MQNYSVTPRETTAAQTIHTKPRIIKNVAVMCTGVLLLFISYDGLTMLQSTMNIEHGVGVMSQAVLYICYSVSSLLFPKYFIKKLGSKLTYAFSMLTYIPYIASNFYPHWSLMIPTSIVIGIGAPLLWGSQDNYLNDVSVIYADLLTSEDGKHSLTEKSKLVMKRDRQSSSLSVNCISVDNGVVASYRKESFDSDGRYICCTKIERGCVTFQSENRDEKYKEINAKTISSQKSVQPYLGAHQSSECRSSNLRKNFVCVGQSASSCILRNVQDSNQANVKSEVAMTNNPKKSIESPTVPTFLDSNQIADKDCKTNAASSDSQSQIDADHRAKFLGSVTARFFGVHGLIYLSSHLWSNLMSYYVLRGDDLDYIMVRNSSCKCGADFCNAESITCLQDNMQLPSDATRYLLTGVCVCLALVAVVVVFLFLDPVEDKKQEDVRFSLDLVAATFKLAKRKELLLLMPSSLYLGMAQGFFAGEFNKSFVGCAWGSTSHVGPVAICYGLMCAISSFTSGWSVRVAGRLTIFTIAALLNAASCALLLSWTPDPTRPAVFFVAAGMWGCYVGTMWPQLRAFYGVLFKKDEEAAFATFHMWYSLGFCVSFAYTNYLCTSFKIYVLLLVSTAGFLGCFNLERRHAKGEIK